MAVATSSPAAQPSRAGPGGSGSATRRAPTRSRRCSTSATARSGGYERGDHIVDPRTGRAPHELLSLTVVGPSLTYADAYATIGFVLGLDGLAWVDAQDGYGAYAITVDRRSVWTPVVDHLLAA